MEEKMFYASAVADMKAPIWITFHAGGGQKLSIEIPTSKNKACTKASLKNLETLREVCDSRKGWIDAGKFITNLDLSELGIFNEVARDVKTPTGAFRCVYDEAAERSFPVKRLWHFRLHPTPSSESFC